MYDDRGHRAEFHLSAAQVRLLDARLTQMRDEQFPQEYFAPSPWRMLLDIERATHTGKPYPHAGPNDMPPTTALRYLAMFERDGLVEFRPDPQLEGRDLIVLTHKGASALNAVFEQAALAFNDLG
ncbi:MAG: hypothetical protein ABI898_07755 [Sphingomonadales bacterium]